jgi:hypothetical protein
LSKIINAKSNDSEKREIQKKLVNSGIVSSNGNSRMISKSVNENAYGSVNWRGNWRELVNANGFMKLRKRNADERRWGS